MKTFSSGRQRGVEALTEVEHAELLQLWENKELTLPQLAVRFRVSVPTIYAWARRPLGYVSGRGVNLSKNETPASPQQMAGASDPKSTDRGEDTSVPEAVGNPRSKEG